MSIETASIFSRCRGDSESHSLVAASSVRPGASSSTLEPLGSVITEMSSWPRPKLFSSRPRWRMPSTSRTASRRSTARRMIRWVLSQLRCSSSAGARMLLATISTSMATASNISVNRECGSAHGAAMFRTPYSGQFARGTRALSTVSNCIVSRCRHCRSGAWSFSGQASPHSGQTAALPTNSSEITTRFAATAGDCMESVVFGWS